jgi:hypothetical protein
MAEKGSMMPPEVPTKVAIHVYLDSRLRDLIEALADERNIAVSDCAAAMLAQAAGRPELGAVPRKRMGRPRASANARKPTQKGGKDDEHDPEAKPT